MGNVSVAQVPCLRHSCCQKCAPLPNTLGHSCRRRGSRSETAAAEKGCLLQYCGHEASKFSGQRPWIVKWLQGQHR